MKLNDTFAMALIGIRHRNLRSWLTILGIVIGMASIVSLIGLSMGMSKQISQRINSIGSNIITISPGGQQAHRSGAFSQMQFRPPEGGLGTRKGQTKLTFREADELRSLPGVSSLDARIEGRASVSYIDKNLSLSVIGTEPASFPESVGVGLVDGRYLSTSDLYSAVLGFNVANSTFNDLDIINKQIKIKGIAFRVVGILQQSGSSFGGSSDDAIFIPQRTAKTLFNQTSAASQFAVVAAQDYDIEEVAAELENALIDLHGVTKETENFQIITAATLASAVSSITDTLSLFLGGIASISLLVGAIGVANTMFMSVLEQTKEIGVLKSLGAKNSDIISLFLLEAGIIGFVGGFLGVLLSFVVSTILSYFSVPMLVTLELVLVGLVTSVVIGVVAGLAPARNAAHIPPVEALRYE